MRGYRPRHYLLGFLIIAAAGVAIKFLGWLFGWGVLR